MNYQLVKTEMNMATIRVTVPAADFAKAITAAFNKNKNKFAVPGFRKGKVPQNIIEKQYGEGVFFEDALDIILPEAYGKAIDELKIEVVARPDIDIVEMAKGKDLIFEAVVAVKPEVKLGAYKGVEAKKVSGEVTEEILLAELEKSREMNARLVSIEDRAVANGDTITMDYKGFVGEEQFDGGTAENQTLVIGSGRFIPGFEEQLVGKNIGEDVEVHVTFPEEYHAPNLAGQAAKFEVKIHGIKVKEMPELDDEFAKDTSEFETLEELKADIKAKLAEGAAKNAELATRDNVVDAVVANLEADIPAPMVDMEIEGMVRDFDYQLRNQGLDLENYLKFTGSKLDDLKAQMRGDAEIRVKTALTLEEVAKLENIEVTEEDLENELNRIAEAQKVSIEEVRTVFGRDDFDYIKNTLTTKKTVDLLVEHANLV